MVSVTLEISSLLVLLMHCCVFSQTCVSPTPKCDCFETEGKKIINCRYKNLTEIPTFTDTHLIYDEIRFTSLEDTGTCQPFAECNNIRRLHANAFANLKVKTIDLRNNPISDVDMSAFNSLVPTLTSLLLEGDGSNTIPYQALAQLDVYLKSLHLENYGSAVLQIPVVLPFPNLESLSLINWKNLTSIQPDILRIMQNVTRFRLEKMPSLTFLPVPALQTFQKLSSLYIIDTGIDHIFGDSFAPLNGLKEVNILNNIHLKSIARNAFNGVKDTIVFLDISSNSLDNIDFLRGALWTSLYQLNIGYNFEIRTFIPGIFRETPALRYINCQDIGLTRIDKNMFVGLSNLHTLDLSFNQINSVSTGAFQNMPFLVDLRINDQNTHNTRIHFQNNSFFGIEASVEILNINNNRFDLDQFWKDLTRLTNLKVLDISNTGINNLPDNAFKGNTELNSLILSGNNISSLKQNTFHGARLFLQTINLRGNALQSIDKCVVNDFPSIPTFTLYGNPLVCDCDLVWLYDWYSSQNNRDHLTLDMGKCTSPTTLANKFFNQFSRNEMCSGTKPAKTCPDVPTVNGSSSSTIPVTTSATATILTTQSLPQFELIINNVGENFIEVTWTIGNLNFISEIKLEIISNEWRTKTTYLGIEQKSFTFYQLSSETYYTICLVLKFQNEFKDGNANCKSVVTLRKQPDPNNVIG